MISTPRYTPNDDGTGYPPHTQAWGGVEEINTIQSQIHQQVF